MKKILILVLLTIVINSFSQTGKITYSIESLKTDKLDNPMVNGIIEEWKQISCVLTYDNNNSYFKINKNIPIEEKWNGLSKVISETYTD